jgi:hypothetical protein
LVWHKTALGLSSSIDLELHSWTEFVPAWTCLGSDRIQSQAELGSPGIERLLAEQQPDGARLGSPGDRVDDPSQPATIRGSGDSRRSC